MIERIKITYKLQHSLEWAECSNLELVHKVCKDLYKQGNLSLNPSSRNDGYNDGIK